MPFQLIAITNRALCPEPLAARVAALCNAGIDRVIVREKDLPERAYEALLHEILDTVAPEQREIITVNTFTDVAQRMGIASVQLSFPQLHAHPAFTHEFSEVGVSVHGVAEAREAQVYGADFLLAGHIFPTDCKAGLAPRGLDFLREICDATGIAVYGIGGIDEETVTHVKEAGAAGACLMSGLMTCDDVSATIQRLRRTIA